MPMIEPRKRSEKTVRLIVKVSESKHKTLIEYARFLGEDVSEDNLRSAQDYVVDEAIGLLEQDNDFMKWRETSSDEVGASRGRRGRNAEAA